MSLDNSINIGSPQKNPTKGCPFPLVYSAVEWSSRKITIYALNNKDSLSNLGKKIWAVAAFIVRIAIICLFSWALGGAYAAHKIHEYYSGPKIDHDKKTEKAAPPVVLKSEKEETQKTNTTQFFGENLRNLKKTARFNYETRLKYFKFFNDNVSGMFSTQGFIGRFHRKPNPELIDLCREGYLVLNHVYRFDGPEMVGRKVSLIQANQDGTESEVVYHVEKYFSEKRGLVGYGLKPENGDAPPRLIFRGTNNGQYGKEGGARGLLPNGMICNAAGALGKPSYDTSKKEIGDWLRAVSENGRNKVVVSGHSLGGIFAQRVAADHGNLVSEVFTINTARIEKGIIDPAKPSLEHMKIRHVLMTGDRLIPKAGGGRRFSSGTLLSNGKNEPEVISVAGGGHNSRILNGYCLEGKEVQYTKLTVSRQLARDRFWAAVINFLRPQVVLS